MGALATTISSQVSEEPFVTVCLVGLVSAGTVTYTREQALPESRCSTLAWTCFYQVLHNRAKTEVSCPFPSTVLQDRVL